MFGECIEPGNEEANAKTVNTCTPSQVQQEKIRNGQNCFIHSTYVHHWSSKFERLSQKSSLQFIQVSSGGFPFKSMGLVCVELGGEIRFIEQGTVLHFIISSSAYKDVLTYVTHLLPNYTYTMHEHIAVHCTTCT